MNKFESTYFSKGALKALNRIGDIMIPQNEEFPSFSQSGGLKDIDALVAYAPVDDIKSLNSLLGILAIMPNGILNWVLKKMHNAKDGSDGPISSLFRQLDFGMRGLIYSCYYSEKIESTSNQKSPIDIIGFEVTRVD